MKNRRRVSFLSSVRRDGKTFHGCEQTGLFVMARLAPETPGPLIAIHNSDYGERQRYDFFVHHLPGIEPPDRNQ